MFKLSRVIAALLFTAAVTFTLVLAMGSAIGKGDRIAAELTSSGGHRIQLFNEPGPHCQNGAMSATFKSPGETIIHGCWKYGGNGLIAIAFMDGDSILVPVGMFSTPEEI
jgi:hypothetical protein